MARHDLPQTVGAARAEGWQWLSVRCAYCRRTGQVMLAEREESERLASIIMRMRCQRCPQRTPQVDATIGFASTHRHEKAIDVCGTNIIKVGMT